MGHFRIFDKKKQNRHFLTQEPRLRAKNQEIPMRGLEENLADGYEREEGEFIVPNPPSGRRTKNQKILMNGFRKMRKTPFLAKMADLDSFWPKWAKREFFKKALGTFYRAYKF